MTLHTSLIIRLAGCSQPVEPSPYERLNASVLATAAVPTDSACRALTITLSGSNNVTVAFPNRSQCGNGLVLIPGGAPSRGGPAKRNVSIPLRLLNANGYAVQAPVRVVSCRPPTG